VKRFARSPWPWIVVAVLLILFALQYIASPGGYDEIKTSQMMQYISDGQVKSITLVDGGDQTIKATLKDGVRPEGADVTSHWLDGTQAELQQAIQKDIDNKTLEPNAYDVSISHPSLIGQIVTTLLPFVLIVLLFLFLMNQVQGGGGRGVMQFAKSRAKLITKDMPKTTFSDVAGADEAVEELGEIKEFPRSRPSSRRSAPRSPRASCSTALPAPARRCSPARSRVRPACPSTPSPAPTSSRCSSVSARAGCATCSSRPRRTPRPSSSSTRSTP
jgi:hypothetical protein